MSTNIPDIIIPLLNEYVRKLKTELGNIFYGLYLYNSIALGAFDSKKSDIDFVVILKKDFSMQDVKRLEFIHKGLLKKYPYAKKMEGMYIPFESIGKSNEEIKPYFFIANSKLHLQGPGYYDINYITWWTLKYNGIAFDSPGIKTLHIDVTWENLLETLEYNLNVYWKSKLQKNFIFLIDSYIEFSIMTLCRILYTLKNKTIISKSDSIQFAIKILPSKFHLILKESLRIREDISKASLFRSRIKRAKEAKELIEYIIEYCNFKYNL